MARDPPDLRDADDLVPLDAGAARHVAQDGSDEPGVETMSAGEDALAVVDRFDRRSTRRIDADGWPAVLLTDRISAEDQPGGQGEQPNGRFEIHRITRLR